MTEQLPISIQVSEHLVSKIKNIAAISNKLEAQLNFHTMTANWYGEEDNILWTHFNLLCVDEFNENVKQESNVAKEFLADDVLMFLSANKLLDCHVAITESELLLLTEKPKLLSGYLGKKLTKILNLIAQRHGFEKI